MKFNKSPVSDGLIVEFYSHSFNILGPLLTIVLNEGYSKSELTYIPRTSIVSLIYKKRMSNKSCNQ